MFLNRGYLTRPPKWIILIGIVDRQARQDRLPRERQYTVINWMYSNYTSHRVLLL
jgi:hypothetical protein